LQACTFALLVSGLQALAHDAATPFAIGQIACAFVMGWALVRH
jgi:hypothetical protein